MFHGVLIERERKILFLAPPFFSLKSYNNGDKSDSSLCNVTLCNPLSYLVFAGGIEGVESYSRLGGSRGGSGSHCSEAGVCSL